MNSLVQKEIITELKESGEDFENIIAGTYSLDPQFFEDVILKIFQQKDAKRIVLMVDSRHYEETFKVARNAGVMYCIEPVYLSHDFHPKFILMTSEETGKLLVGSANLTENALIRNGEVFTFIDYDLVKEYPDILPVFVEMKGFLTSLSQVGLVRSRKHEEQILNSLEVPWLADAKPLETNHRLIRVLHSIKRPILSQVRAILDEEEVTRITIASPFFDLKGRILRYLVDNFCDTIQLFIQPDRVGNFPIKTLRKLRKDGNDISAFKIAFRNDINRFMHAKIILFETDKGSYCLSGSANATAAGLLSNSKKGNVELCLLRYEKKRKSFDYLLKNKELESKRVSTSSLNSNPLSPPAKISSPDIYIEEARLESNDLFVNFSPLVGNVYKHATVTISRPVSVKPIIIKQKLSERGRLVIDLSENKRRFCEQSSFVTLELRRKPSSNRYLSSNKRWISTEVLERTPRERDVRIVEKTNGRVGLIRLMNQLDEASEIPTMLLYYLQYLDFDWLADSLGRSRRRIVRKSIGDEGSEDEEATFERYELTAEEVLEKIINRHEKKFEQMIEDVEQVKDLQTRVTRMFDLSLFINKIVIWFILRKNVGEEELPDMVRRMQLLVGTKERFWYRDEGLGYFDRVKEIMGKKKFLEVYKELDVLPQFMVLSKIILALAKDTSKELYSELKEKLGHAIKNACMKKNKKKEIANISKDRLMGVVEEYEEYEHFTFSYKRLLNRIRKIIEYPEPQGPCDRCRRITRFRIDSDTYLCPVCARKRFGKTPVPLILMQCRKCNHTKWMPAERVERLEFCEKDGMLMYRIPGTFYIPRYA